jgi:hypothetical protein
MAHPKWLIESVLSDAAIATANARRVAAEIRAQGRDHYNDPTWRDAAATAQRATDKAEEIGISPQAILDASKAR